jgi:hypothetical protein
MKYRVIASLIIFIIPGLSYISADVYRWTDAKGNVAYGNQPPANARNLQLVFKEYVAPPDAGTTSADETQSDAAATLQQPVEKENTDNKAQQSAEPAQRNSMPSRQETIAQEESMLQKKIAELEALPLDYFGSQKNKRLRIGYYQNRLTMLRTNPDDYFANPVPFEGNIKPPDQKQ